MKALVACGIRTFEGAVYVITTIVKCFTFLLTKPPKGVTTQIKTSDK